MSEERYKDALKQIDGMNPGPRVREIIRRAFHPDEPCPECKGAGEVPNTNRWCVFEEEGPLTIKCVKFNKYVQNSDICKNCLNYTPKHSKMKCPSCGGRKEII